MCRHFKGCKVLGKDVYIFRLRKGCKDHIIFELENGTLIYTILARVYVEDIIIVLILFVYMLSNSFKTMCILITTTVYRTSFY